MWVLLHDHVGAIDKISVDTADKLSVTIGKEAFNSGLTSSKADYDANYFGIVGRTIGP